MWCAMLSGAGICLFTTIMLSFFLSFFLLFLLFLLFLFRSMPYGLLTFLAFLYGGESSKAIRLSERFEEARISAFQTRCAS